jgi:hypothetical protein
MSSSWSDGIDPSTLTAGPALDQPDHQGVPVLDLNRSVITRQHVMRLLPLMGLSPAQEEALLSLPYPVPFEVAARAFGSVGVDMDTLMDRMGASP